jgi:HEAT repeats
MRYRQLLLVLFSFALAFTAFAAEKLSTEELIQNLKATNPKVREEAAKEVGDRGEKLGLEALDQATLDKDPKVQLAVVEALGKIQNPQQVVYLGRAIRNTSGKAQEKAMRLITEIYIPSQEHGKLRELLNSLSALLDPGGRPGHRFDSVRSGPEGFGESHRSRSYSWRFTRETGRTKNCFLFARTQHKNGADMRPLPRIHWRSGSRPLSRSHAEAL